VGPAPISETRPAIYCRPNSIDQPQTQEGGAKMNEYILFRALFFVAIILMAAVIVTGIAFGSSLVIRSRSKNKRQKKAKIARKWNPVAASGSNRENPLPASTTITFDDCWFHRV